jgi:hypothetical protein
MAYYYQDHNHGGYEYEYADYGNHGNGDYGYEDSYTDHGEPDHAYAEPDHHYHEHDDHGFEHEAAQYEIAGEDHEHRELAHDEEETGIDWEAGYEGEVEGYEHRELEYEEGEVYEHGTLETGTDGAYEHRELNYRAQEPQLEYEHDGDNDAYGFTHTSDHAVEPQRPRCDSDEALELKELERRCTISGDMNSTRTTAQARQPTHTPPLRPPRSPLHTTHPPRLTPHPITPRNTQPQPNSLHTPTSRPSAATSMTGSRAPSHSCGNSGITPKSACMNRRNGRQTGGRRYASTTTSRTPNVIT